MCKNAGKTTALGSILSGFPDSETIALTSIGRDGEKEDVLTGAPKPAIFVRKGSIFATAEDLLPRCGASSEILGGTGIYTPLGEVVVLRALSSGAVELAGPSMVTQLVWISKRFFEYGADRVIFDGAMGRKSLCSRSLTEAAVLSAGAACGDSINEVVAQTAHVCRLLTTPEDKEAKAVIDSACSNSCSDELSNVCSDESPNVCSDDCSNDYSAGKYMLLGNQKTQLPDGADLTAALKRDENLKLLYIEGAVTDRVLQPLLQVKLPCGFKLIARDASKLLLSAGCADKLRFLGVQLGVLESIRLAAVTINPYSAFGKCFDKTEFIEKMTAVIPVPVINVEDGGAL